MKIAGFTLGKKHFIILGIIVGIIAIAMLSNHVKNKKEQERVQAEIAERDKALEDANKQQATTEYEFDYDAEIQKSLVKTFGEPPEGFEWDMTGNLIALSDDNSTPEDVMYYYVRSLSVLDFSTAQRYSEDSKVIESYSGYYSVVANALTDYYDSFLRKQFKLSLTSLEVLSVEDTAVFADGTEYITIKVACLDLTDKDFWLDDKDEIYQTMRLYDETETDSTKANQYLYDYIYSKYEDGTIGKKEHTIELVVSKRENGSGWLVTGDGELDALLQYKNGVDTAAYILNSYATWLRETQLKETQIELQNQFNSNNNSQTEDWGEEE